MQKRENQKQVDITYEFNFPARAVFEAWTNPSYLKEWFAPHGCTIVFLKLEIEEGGSFHSRIHNPEFGDCWCIGTYHEIVAPKKIVFSMINADENGVPVNPANIGMDPDWPGETLVTVTFSEVDGSTIVNLKQTVAEALAKKTGAYPSWIQMLERMQAFIGSTINYQHQ